MLSQKPSLQPGLYRLPDDPVATTVLIPGFRSATSVRGAFGWFTAGWIGRLAPGLADYLHRPSAEPLDFTVAPVLFPAERSAIERGAAMTPEQAAQLTANVFVDGRPEATALGRHALDCLAWMIATQRLRLRIAVPAAGSNYHPEDLALRRWRQSRFGQRIWKRYPSWCRRWCRTHRCGRVMDRGEPGPGKRWCGHARRLVNGPQCGYF